MLQYLKKLKLPENPEVLVMLIIGILFQIIDGSPFTMKYRWNIVWDIELPAEYFSPIAQKIIKTIIVIIIIVRCSTTYAYVVFAILVIFSLLKRSTPKLLLPWLLVSAIKSIFMTFIEAIAGVYVCSAFGKIRRPCIEFFISKALEIIFAAYLWGSILSIYQDMELRGKNERNSAKNEIFSNFTRQRARSLLDESTLYRTACLNNFEFKDVPQIILQMLRRDDEMSEDSLLGPGMMLASISNLGSFDSLKTSQSLGELGFTDLGTTQVFGLEEDENLSYQDKAMRFLKLTRSDVAKIKINKSTLEDDIFTVEDDIWAQVMASGTHINKPKQTRTEVFIREIPQPDENSNKLENQTKGTLKFDITFSDLLVERQEEIQDDEEEESMIMSQEEEEGVEDEDTFRMFMSNIKDGVYIRRERLGLGIKVMKGNRYEKLYKQDFMSTIGPEVFERATNLPKVTSFTKVMRHSVSLPEIPQNSRKKICRKDPTGKFDPNSNSDLHLKNSNLFKIPTLPEEALSEEEIQNIIEKTSTADETFTEDSIQSKCATLENESHQDEDRNLTEKTTNEPSDIEDENCSPSLNNSIKDIPKVTGIKPCLKKKRIIIRRVRGRCSQPQKLSFDSQCLSKNSIDQVMNSQTQIVEEKAEDLERSNTTLGDHQDGDSLSDHNSIEKTHSSFKNSQIQFITQILQKPYWKVSISYLDSSKMADSPKTSELWSREFLPPMEFSPGEGKVWKSNVFKTVEMCFLTKTSRPFASSLLNKINNDVENLSRSRSFSDERNQSPSGSTISSASYSPRIKSVNFDIEQEDTTLKEKSETQVNFSEISESSASMRNINEGTEIYPEGFKHNKTSDFFLMNDNKPHSSKALIRKKDSGSGKKSSREKGTREKKLSIVTPSEENSFCSHESDEPISLFYSKAADLASPLLDVKRFIYPDHIHYSYKHFNKKGFDVDINGGFPLLVGENLPITTPVNKINGLRSKKEPEIKRRPMDLSFATSNSFADWQNNYSCDLDAKQDETTDESKKESESPAVNSTRQSKLKKKENNKKRIERRDSQLSSRFSKPKTKSKGKNFNDITFMYYAKDYVLVEKLIRMHMKFNKIELLDFNGVKNDPDQISSTQLHSNKGRKNSIKNPAIFLRKSKNRSEKKKKDTQEERTKDMFARLASEAFLQNNNLITSSASKRNI